MPKTIQLNVRNIQKLLNEPKTAYETLRFDSNNDCNVHCVYCHNARSKDIMAFEDFERFLNEHVSSLQVFQVGCVMEPTLDKRMCDFMLKVSRSKVKPSYAFVLQTNGILLHRHSAEKMHEAGLTDLSVSIDAVDPAVHKALRGGTSLPKVRKNLEQFRKDLPDVKMIFITTVTRLNIGNMKELVRVGLELGVRKFVLREMYYYPNSKIVDHSRMPGLVLEDGEFARMREDLQATYGGKAIFSFTEEDILRKRAQTISTDSLLTQAWAKSPDAVAE